MIQIPWPFRFPKHGCGVRRHGPRGYSDYRRYKPWLRDEFDFRCIYCLTRERWERDPKAAFSVEHLTPKSVAPQSSADYANLAYACNTCNSQRQATPLPLDVREESIGQHVFLDANGWYVSKSAIGEMLIDLLTLNRSSLIEHRRKALCAYARAIGRHPGATGTDFDQFRYPDDLPDLSQCIAPEGNDQPEGIALSAFARRHRGDLPEFY